MPDQTRLTGGPLPQPIAPGGYSLQAPDLTGTVVALSDTETATRSDGGRHDARLQQAIQSADIYTQKVFELEVTAPLGPATPGGAQRAAGLTATTREGEPAVVLRVPSLQDGLGYAVLYTDEAGVSRWIYPEPAAPATAAAPAPAATRGGGGEITFHLPRESAPAPPEAADAATSRGPLARLGRRLVRVLAWATDDIVGKGALGLATAWERTHRPYAFRTLPLADTTQPVVWERLRQGRALLLLHGTFSTARGAFAGLDPDTLGRLTHLYDGRVFAFDHPSLHVSPHENVQTLLDMLPAGIELELDVVTHSRGGLVGRELIERVAAPQAAGRRLAVRRAVFVAAPNRGTILTDGDYGIDLLDRYTNLLTALPDDAFTLTIEGVLIVVKLLLHGALKGLPGLASMHPQGEFVRRSPLVPPGKVHYYALGANFTPTAPGLLARFGRMVADRFVDSVFGEDNDGVVPTLGTYESATTSAYFPIPPERRLVYAAPDQIHHCNYFGSERVDRQLVAWLGD